MKSCHLLCLWVLALFSNHALAQKLGETYPRITLKDGYWFDQAEVTRFDGERFYISHREGLATVEHANMPAEWQRAFPAQAKPISRPEAQAKVEPDNRISIADVTPPPAPSCEQKTVRVELPGNRWVHLVSFGGPNQHMLLSDVEMTFIRVRFSHLKDSIKIPIKAGGRTHVFSDGRGCSVYYVDTINRPAGGGVFEFDHTPNSAFHPDRVSGVGGGIWAKEKMRVYIRQ